MMAVAVTKLGRSVPVRSRLLVAGSLAATFVTSLRNASSDILCASRDGLDLGCAVFICIIVRGSVIDRMGFAGGISLGEAFRPDLWVTSAAVPFTAQRESGRTNLESFAGTAGGESVGELGASAGGPTMVDIWY